MNTRQNAAENRLSHWAQIMRDKHESGLSIKTYCERAGFHQSIFYYWQRKLRETACEQLTEIHPAPPSTNVAVQGFAEVKLLAPSDRVLPRSAGNQQGQVRVEIYGMQISADPSYPPSMLAELLKGLVAPC